MKQCPHCAEQIQDEAIKCRHCGEWLNGKAVKPFSSSLKESEDTNTTREISIRPWYKKWWVIVLAFFILLFLFGRVADMIDSRNNDFRLRFDDSRKKSSSSGGNNLYFTGYTLGSSLASRHSYYKGTSYIQRECKGFVENYVGSSGRDADYMFIRGCVNGYKEAFGK